jgi:hypothetical protein
MDLELPENLRATRDLLTRSLIMHREQAPAIPAGLARDLADRFATRTPAPQPLAVSWLEKIRGFLATPAFGAVAAAVLVIGVAVPLLPESTTSAVDTFRGTFPDATGVETRILFVGNNPEILASVRASGIFEPSSLHAVDGMVAAGVIPGPKVVVDFTSGTITAINHRGTTLDHSSLPARAEEVSTAIAAALSRLN